MRLGPVGTRWKFFFPFLFLFSCAQPVCFGRRRLFAPQRLEGRRQAGEVAAGEKKGGQRDTVAAARLKARDWLSLSEGESAAAAAAVCKTQKSARFACVCMCDSLLLPRKMKRSVWPGAHRKELWTLTEGAGRKKGTRAHGRAHNLNRGFCAKRALFFFRTFQTLKYDN